MTEKGLKTREHLIKTSALLFNTLGYSGTSVDRILEKAGYSKGALYRTFQDKDEIATEAFKHNLNELSSLMIKHINQAKSAKDKLNAMLNFYKEVLDGSQFPGGCPILNTAIEFDDTNDHMRVLVKNAFKSWEELIREILQKGLEDNEFSQNIDIESLPNFIIATLEGSIALSKASKDSSIALENIKILKTLVT